MSAEPSKVKIRKALPEESAALTRIAHDSKRHWGYPEHWIKHWEQDLTISPEFISKNDVYVAEQEAVLVGFYALVVKQRKAELEHMWVTPSCIGQGVGKELFYHAMHRAAGQEVSAVEICADPNAAGFYERLGATRVGEIATQMDGEPRILPRLEVDPRQD